MLNPEELTLQQVPQAAESQSEVSHRSNVLKMLAGDHWLGGAGWVGPRPPANATNLGDFLNEVQRQLVPKNALKEIMRRHRGAVIGRYPIIKLALRNATAKPTPEQEKEMKEGEGALTDWLDHTQALAVFQQFTTHLLLGKAHLRGYIPSGELKEGLVPEGDLLTSIRRIRFTAPKPGLARVIDDEETGYRYAVYESQGQNGEKAAEICYLKEGKTILRRVESVGALPPGHAGPLPPEGLSREVGRSAGLDMHGLLTITEAEREQLLTPTLVKNNFMLNFAKTAILRNAELAAILERYGIGILPPGRYVDDPDSPGAQRYEADPGWQPGGGQATFFAAQTYGDEQNGLRSAGSAQYGRFEPVNPAALITTKTDAYHDMLDEACQSHIKMSGDATASGESRVQAMNDFKTSLYDTATALEAAISRHLEMTLAWAAALSGEEGRFRDYRVVVQCRILAAQPTTQERAQVLAEKEAGLRSTENAMSEIGIEDTDQMLAAVSKEQEEALARGQAAAEGLTKFLAPPGSP